MHYYLLYHLLCFWEGVEIVSLKPICSIFFHCRLAVGCKQCDETIWQKCETVFKEASIRMTDVSLVHVDTVDSLHIHVGGLIQWKGGFRPHSPITREL